MSIVVVLLVFAVQNYLSANSTITKVYQAYYYYLLV